MISGTPGRIMDMINRKALVLDKLKLFVLDEVDEMLRENFSEQIKVLCTSIPAC